VTATERHLHNEASALHYAQEKGKQAVALNMLKSGFPAEQVASLSGLDIEKIKALTEQQ